MKRVLPLLIALVMVFSLLSGCGTTPVTTTPTPEATSSTEPTAAPEAKLEGKLVWATNRTDIADTTLTEMAKEFTAMHPGVTIEVEGLKDEAQTLAVRLAANELTDITTVLGTITNPEFPNYFLPLDGFSKDTLIGYNDCTGPDGKLYIVTDTVVYNAMCYNKAVFKAAGVTAVPKNMDEFYAACEKIKAAGFLPVATSFKDQWPLYPYAAYDFLAVLLTKNTKYNVEIANRDELFTNDGGLLAAFEIARTLNQKGYFEPDLLSTSWDQTKADFAGGKVGMMYMESWFPPHMYNDNGAKKEDMGMFPFPSGNNMITATISKTHAVAKNTKYPEAAKEFFKFLFADGKYAKTLGQVPPIVGAKVECPAVAELLTYGAINESVGKVDGEAAKNIANQAQIGMEALLQDYIISDKPEEVIKKANEAWAKARKEVLAK